jgi:hypothetical protein
MIEADGRDGGDEVVSDHDSNDPEQILKNPLDEILIRLGEDSNRLKSLGAVDPKPCFAAWWSEKTYRSRSATKGWRRP